MKLNLNETMSQLDDRSYVLDQVEKDGWNLSIVDKKFRKDKDVVFVASKQNYIAFQWADESLKIDKEFVMSLIKAKSAGILEYADRSFRYDEKFMFEAVKYDHFALYFASQSIKINIEIAKVAVKHSPFAIEYIDKSIYENDEIKTEVCKTWPRNIHPYPYRELYAIYST